MDPRISCVFGQRWHPSGPLVACKGPPTCTCTCRRGLLPLDASSATSPCPPAQSRCTLALAFHDSRCSPRPHPCHGQAPRERHSGTALRPCSSSSSRASACLAAQIHRQSVSASGLTPTSRLLPAHTLAVSTRPPTPDRVFQGCLPHCLAPPLPHHHQRDVLATNIQQRQQHHRSRYAQANSCLLRHTPSITTGRCPCPHPKQAAHTSSPWFCDDAHTSLTTRQSPSRFEP